MEKSLKIKLLLILVAIFGLITIISDNFSDTNPYFGLYEKNSRIRSNGSWVITSTIHIDDSNSSINWSKTAADNPWCSGIGTWNDPYLIENLTIDGLFEGSCIYIENSNVPFIIRNCTLINIGTGANPNHDSGIRLDTVSNGLIINNTCSFNNGLGINLRNSHNNTVCYNNASNNERTGIYVHTSNVNTIFGNTFNYNDGGGIYIYQGNFNNFSENSVSQTKVSTSDSSTRYIELTGQNNIFSGNIFNNCGIHLREGSLNDLSSHQIDTTNLVNGKPIHYYTNTNDLKKENFTNAGQVILVGCYNCEISGLNMSYGGPGISLFHCDQNTVFNNTISFRYGEIIKLYSSHQNNISHNSISDVGISSGINLRYSNENNVTFNQIINCNTAIEVGTSYRNSIRDNYLDNNFRGIYIQTGEIGDMHNTIMRNIISNNTDGIYTTSPYTRNNTIYLNNFINNGVNAENNGGSNNWDNGSIGNYWDDYEGNDTDDDGIGDTPYYIPGTAGDQDNFPIWDDDDDIPPIVSIILPFSGQLFGITAPNFSVNVYDLYLDTMWYTIDSGLNNYTFLSNGTLNQNGWDLRLNGTVILRIYANDTSGNINYDEVIIQKDSESPVITINYPLLNNLFGITAPSFNVEIYDANLDTMWYTLDNGATNTTFTANGTISQSAWDTIPDGTVSIRFYANDSAGNIGFAEVTIKKDVTAPIIAINNPQNSHVIGAVAPNFEISIDELNLDKTWYSLNGGNNVTFTELTGIINQALWDALSDGNVIINFYANDTLGRIGFQEVTVVKLTSQSNPPGIPGYNILLLLGIVSTIAIIIIKKRLEIQI